MWTYLQKTGILLAPGGGMSAIGYSGSGPGKDNPAWQDHHDVGPIPAGGYRMLEPYSSINHGPYVIALVSDTSNIMFGRSGFLIHGDSIAHSGSASHGCIILPKSVRKKVWESGDHRLEVRSGAEMEA